MKKKLLMVGIVSLFIVAVLSPQPVDGCFKCSRWMRCDFWGCWPEEYCDFNDELGVGYTSCNDNYGVCTLYGKVCRWA